MVNYVCGFNQSETGKYFEWIINNFIGWGFSRVKANADNTYRDLDYLKGRPIRKLMGGGAKYKKYSRKGKLNEKKIHARQLTLKNIHAIA